MKAIVLAGGYATRLWPITLHRPKMFLPVGRSKVIDTILYPLESDDRISTIYVSTNGRFKENFRAYLDNRPFNKTKLSIEGTAREAEKPGVIGALAELIERENIDENTVVIAGDNVISFDVSSFIDEFLDSRSTTIAAYDIGSPTKTRSFGVLEVEDERVTTFSEKPDEPLSSLISVACYGFPVATLDLIDEYLAAGNNPDEPGWFIQWLVDRQPVHVFTFDGDWFDIGTRESYLDAVAWELEGDTIVHPTATLNETELGENVHLMADVTVQGSTLENTVVFSEATIRDAEVDRSVIDQEATVRGATLESSLIGTHSEVRRKHQFAGIEQPRGVKSDTG